MLDFLKIAVRTRNRGVEIYPKFVVGNSTDLMIRGRDFYAVWVESLGMWSTSELDAVKLIDEELSKYAEEYSRTHNEYPRVLYLWDSESGMIDAWHRYCQKQLRDNYVTLDEELIFSNTITSKESYASKKLSYPLEPCDISAYEKLISTLYSEEERHKIEWAIGSIVTGDSKKLQKFLVLYGAAGTGKSTILNIIQQLFDGYYSIFDAKALGSSSAAFALEAFKSNPLVAIQHDGDLSKIEDNTRLNSLVSHELMNVNEKFKSIYSTRFKSFLFMGTNRPVKITDAKSGLLRRLIDVTPSGNKLDYKEYTKLMQRIPFELGGIAYHCKNVYLDNPNAYDNYTPSSMMGASNDFFNFVMDSYVIFHNEDGTSLKSAWELYKKYCEDAKVPYTSSQRVFKEEMKNYFEEFKDYVEKDGVKIRGYFSGFKADKFLNMQRTVPNPPKEKNEQHESWLEFSENIDSKLDAYCRDCVAQYANRYEVPGREWASVRTKLADLDTRRLHYVKLQENHIFIDFDLKDENGNKSFDLNVQEASKWPPTYAEVSKGGNGIHLHYIYTGDVTKLSRIFSDGIEIKVQIGDSSLRRRLSRCNDLDISTISSGLPLKGEKKLINWEGVKNEKILRAMIRRNLEKEYHPATKPSIDYIYNLLEEAYNSGLKYDVTDLRNAVLAFAANSTNQSEYCIKLVSKMKFKSEEANADSDYETDKIVFFDVEVFPNLFLVNWKFQGKDNPVIRMINPSPAEIENLIKYKLVGFNCRGYDNHILYARLLGYSNKDIYNLSQKIISGRKDAMFREAYNISYTDVYDFSSKKQSLKKFEIDLHIHHKELGLPWDKPVPEDKWLEVAEYCDNDVIATEAVFENRAGDFAARQILASLSGGTVNDTTNTLSTRIIFGNNRTPQNQFNYRNMGIVTPDATRVTIDKTGILYSEFGDEYTIFDGLGRPIFPGYKYEYGTSTYRGEVIGEGGYVYAVPGIYYNVVLLDVASMHPSSIIAEKLFGEVYTKRFEEIRDARVAIKNGDFKLAKGMLDGALAEYIDSLETGTAWFTADDLAQALKIVINSIYGLTAASFDNPFRDPRNVDNIVAKRGALFMVNLKHEVQKRGYTVAHIKTDSIKIPGATPEMIQFVMDYGKMYGYEFEHEATYNRMCLVNDAVYIAKYETAEVCQKLYGYVPKDIKKHSGEWTATGTQFKVPYVFKKLFSKEPIEFEDLCETKSVTTSIYLDYNESLPDVSKEEARHESLKKALKKTAPDDSKGAEICAEMEKLSEEIEKGHDYSFVGRVGCFTPVISGVGGGILVRSNGSKYDSLSGTIGYRWLESELVRENYNRDVIDYRYYNSLVDKAVDAISKYGDFELFIADDLSAPPWTEPEEP